MKTIYKTVTICGNHVETMNFPSGIQCGKRNRIQPIKGKRKQNKIRFSSINRTKQRLRRLVWCNEPFINTFITLTFKDEIIDLKTANKKLRNFIKRITYRMPSFLYIGVPEFQKKGRVHYHLLTNVSYMSNHDLSKIWTNGFVTIKALNTVNNMSRYLTKYLTKSNTGEDERYFNMKKIFYSKNIHKPEVIKDPRGIYNYFDYFEPALKRICETNVEMDFVGPAVYSLYELKFDHVYKESTKEEFDDLIKLLLNKN